MLTFLKSQYSLSIHYVVIENEKRYETNWSDCKVSKLR